MQRLMLLVLACASSLAGCGTAPAAPEPVVRIVEVRVPVPAPCIDAAAIPVRPAVNTLAEILTLTNADAAVALLVQHNLLLGYAGELEGAIAGCR